VSFALYNMVAFLFNMTFDDVAFALPLEGRRSLPVTTGDSLVALAMLLFYIEVLKMARLARKTFMEHALSFLLFAVMAVELTTVPKAATSTLFLLVVLSFLDVHLGASVSGGRAIRAKVAESDPMSAAR